MFDATDGRFLGYLSNRRIDDAFGSYVQITQGPDQCLWSVYRGERAGIERWNTDGTFVDELVPLGVESPDGGSRLTETRSLTFTPDGVLVGAVTSGGVPRILTFSASGEWLDTFVADGTNPSSLLALRDGRVIVGDETQGVVKVRSAADAPWESLLDGVLPTQVAWAGPDQLLVADAASGCAVHQLDLAAGMSETAECSIFDGEIAGVAPLASGMLLVGELAVTQTEAERDLAAAVVWDDLAVDAGSFRHLGRACLPESVVAGAARPSESSCPAEVTTDALVNEGFEHGDFEGEPGSRHFGGFYAAGDSERATLDDTSAAPGSMRSLALTGAGGPSTALVHALPRTPTYLGYYLHVEAAPGRRAYVSLGDGAEHAALLWIEGEVIKAQYSRVATPLADAAWHRIELRNIDWVAGVYDLYVDCARLAEDIPLGPARGLQLQLFNVHAGAAVRFDEVVVR